MAVVWNGVDLGAFASVASTRKMTDVGVLLAVGTIVPRKNAHGVVAALAELLQRGRKPPVVWWLGKQDMSPEGREYYAHLVDLIEQNGVGEYWKWCGEHSELMPFFESADALLHPSLREGLANAICEALAAGRPVLGANLGDNSRLIGSDRGMLFDPHDSTAIANCIQEFSSLTVEQRVRMQASAREFAERELNAERFVGKFERLMVAEAG